MNVDLDKLLGRVRLPPAPSHFNYRTRRIKQLSGVLFGEKPVKFKHVSEIKTGYSVDKYEAVLKNGSKKDVYVKTSLEGASREALGMALDNILAGANHNFITWDGLHNENLVMMEGLPGKKFYVPEGKELEVAYSFGYSMELVNTLALKDRRAVNVLLTGDLKINQIDFGAIFDPNDTETIDWLIKDHCINKSELNKGRVVGREVVYQNFQDHKDLISDLVAYAQTFSDFLTPLGCLCYDDPFNHMQKYLNKPLKSGKNR
jgi:hypothetical protein